MLDEYLITRTAVQPNGKNNSQWFSEGYGTFDS